MGILRLLRGALHGEVSPDVTALRADEHSAFRVVLVIDEGVPFPVTRDEVTSEAVFKVTRIVKRIVKSDDIAFPAPPGRLVGLPVPAVVAGIDDVRAIVLADQARLADGVLAFADGDLGHDFRDVVFQGFQAADPADKVFFLYAHGIAPFPRRP